MTDRGRWEALNRAIKHLKLTKQGYDLKGSEWRAAMKELNALLADLKPVAVPDLGPVWVGGKSILLHDLTHLTAGIHLYPAFDDAFNQGRVIVAPEAIEVISPLTSSNPGDAFYARGRSKIRYWFGHLDRSHAIGAKFQKGDAVGRVAANSIGGGPHCHVGVNVELLLGSGKQLLHHTDYSHGAVPVGAQLRKALA